MSAPTRGVTIDHGRVEGKTISKWTADWWKWILNLPSNANPLTVPNGAFTGANNTGPMFFIAGATQTTPFNVPFDKPLLVPLINIVDTRPEVPPIRETEEKNIKTFDKSVTSLFAKIDGVAITDLFSHLVTTSFFDAGTAQPGTVATDHFGEPPGTHMVPTKSGGYWLVIDHLSRGPHTLEFGGTATAFGGFSVNVTDHINVV
jgi:hypothetical protein